MIPFGPKLNTVFASRWKALVWAGGILLTAYCTMPTLEGVAHVGAKQQAQPEKPVHRNPWALDKK